MSISDEAAAAPKPLQAGLAAGLDTLSSNQVVTFTKYTKFVFSEDGFVFWVKSSDSFDCKGSLHQAIEQNQDEDQTIAINTMIFTAEEEVSRFNEIDSQTLWIGAWVIDEVTIKVAFNMTAPVYTQAGLWHYTGDAVYPALDAQFVDSIDDLPTDPIVSNSLPLWLALDDYAPVYPSYLVPSNIKPPYIAVHIGPEDTKILQQFATYNWSGTQTGPNQYSVGASQLMLDEVKLVLYGFDAKSARQYLSSLQDYSIQTDDFGFCNSPAITDGKRKQSEISAIAQQKIIRISASYYQTTADAVARRLILEATVNYEV